MPDIREKLATLGTLPHPMGPQEFGAFLAKENARWSEAVKSAGVTIGSCHGAGPKKAVNPYTSLGRVDAFAGRLRRDLA